MDILMPQLGETVADGRITTWFRAVGDAVKPGDNLFEIETDKVSMEVPATSAGVLTEIRVAAGETAQVGAVVGVLGAGAVLGAGVPIVSGEKTVPTALPVGERAKQPAMARSGDSAMQASPPMAGALLQAEPPVPPFRLDPFHEVRTPPRNFGPARLPGGTVATPLARRLAGQAGIDLLAVPPSGSHRRITGRDVEAVIAGRAEAATPATPAEGSGESNAKSVAASIAALYPPGSYEEVPLDRTRRTVATRLTEAVRTIPHVHLTADVMVERLLALREEANAAAPTDAAGAPAYRLSVNDFVVKALGVALCRVPAANAVWAEDRILRFKSADIGVAIAFEGGLVTPVIRGVEKRSLSGISTCLKDFAGRARAGKLAADELQGGASAVSNLGRRGVREFTAIINPPHATILAVGAVGRRPVETPEGGVRFTSQMTVTLSCDQRIVDGALGAELLDAFRHAIEHPMGLMI